MLRCMVPDTPALLTITCRPPNFSTAVDTSPLTWSSSDTSASTKSAPAPMSLANAAPASRSMSPISTLAPSAANRRDRPSPSPDAPPVTIATLPVEFVAHQAGCLSLHVTEEIHQQLVDGVGLFDLRAVARLLDDGRAAPRDLLGDLGRPPIGQEFVAPTLDHQRRHGDSLVGALARRQWRRLQSRPAESRRRQAPPTRRARCSTRSASARTRRRSGTPGRETAPRTIRRMPGSVAS